MIGDEEKESLNILKILHNFNNNILNPKHAPMTVGLLVSACGLNKNLTLDLCTKLTEEKLIKTISFNTSLYRITPKGSKKVIKYYGKDY